MKSLLKVSMLSLLLMMQSPLLANDIAIDSVIDKDFVGTIIVANSDGVIYKKSAGFAVKATAKYSASTVVDIASVSKQFTAAAIMTLVQQGKLETTAPISRYINNVPSDKSAVTLHHLLTHTAGFKRHLGRDEEQISKEASLHKALSLPLAFKVGEQYHYSNVGYGLLAQIIENVSGMPYESYLFKHLFAPAGMLSTGYVRPDWSQRVVPALEAPYAGYTSPVKMITAMEGQFYNLIGSGGILSTADDMALWHSALLNETILSKKSQSVMYTPYVSEHDEGYFYGYGWSIKPRENKEALVWHNGMSFFGTAEYWRLPESGMMIFVASHTDDVSPWQVANSIYTALAL